jgi:hypothetical protein
MSSLYQIRMNDITYSTRFESEFARGGVHVTRAILVVRVPLIEHPIESSSGPSDRLQSDNNRRRWVERLMRNMRGDEIGPSHPHPVRKIMQKAAAASAWFCMQAQEKTWIVKEMTLLFHRSYERYFTWLTPRGGFHHQILRQKNRRLYKCDTSVHSLWVHPSYHKQNNHLYTNS